MKASKKMADIIGKIATKHGIDLNQIYASIRLSMPGMDDLVIENVAPNHVKVGHYYAGMPDPEMVFFLSPIPEFRANGWYPTQIHQLLSAQFGRGPRVGMVVDPGDGSIKGNIREQADQNSFAQTWAKNIKDQGWLENGVLVSKDEGWELIAVVDDREEVDA
jgi:hypothetical protein